MIIRGFEKHHPLYFDSACITCVKSCKDNYGGYIVRIWLTSGTSVILEKGDGIRYNGVDIMHDGTIDKADEIADIIGEIIILERG